MRLLILGGGAIVTGCHLPALRAMGWLNKCVLVEPFERNVEMVKELFPTVKVISEPYENVLENADLMKGFEGALIALPNTLHKPATLRCMEKGLPVLCEKPLALTSAECLEIQRAMDRCESLAVVGMVRRRVPALRALRGALEQGLTGELSKVVLELGGDCRHWPWDTETVLRRDQGGCLVNLGIHFLDMLEWLLGRLRPTKYRDDYAGGIEVNCDLHLETASGVPVELRHSWTHKLSNVLSIEGTRGKLQMDLEQYEKVIWKPANGGLEADLRCPQPFESGDWQPSFESCFVEQFWQFAAAVRCGGKSSDLVSPADAARTHEVIEWAYAHRPSRTVSSLASRRPFLSPASVVVTGGTGFVGSHLVERLAELKMTSITVPVRAFRSGGQIARYPMAMKRTDLMNRDSCREAFRGAKHVFHLAYGTSGPDAGKVTLESTRAVLEAALAEGVESVVVFGTCTVWGGYEKGMVNEDSAPQPALAEYGNSKAQMQSECVKFARQHPQMRVSVVAPGSVYGPRGGLFCQTPFQTAKAGHFAWFEGGAGICNYVHVANLVDLAILAAQKDEANGQVFMAVDGQASWREFLMPLVRPWLEKIPDVSMAEVRRLAGLTTRNGSIKDVARAALTSPALMAALSNHPLLGKAKHWVTQRFPSQVQEVQKWRPATEMILKPKVADCSGVALWMADIYGPGSVQFDSSKARRILGWQSLVSLVEGMDQSVAWLSQVEVSKD